MKIKTLFLIGLFCVVTGCAGPQLAMNPGATKLIERTPDKKPDWVDWAQTAKIEKDRHLFVGVVKDRADFALTVREAGIEATKIVMEQLVRELNGSLRSSVAGQNIGDDLGRSIQDIFVQESRNVRLTGLVQRERFVERWAEGTVGGQRTIYHGWVLMEIGKPDFLAAKQALLDLAAGRAREGRNAEAQRLLEEFRAEIKSSRETARQP